MEVHVVFGERQGWWKEGLLWRDPKRYILRMCHADVLLTDDLEVGVSFYRIHISNKRRSSHCEGGVLRHQKGACMAWNYACSHVLHSSFEKSNQNDVVVAFTRS